MLRTKAGHFYSEYINNEFIAIGWNSINKESLSEKDEQLKQLIASNYASKVPGNALSKCKNFINELHQNDIIIIIGSGEIAFAKVGKYYEVEDPALDYIRELEVHQQIEAKIFPVDGISCPYNKRRHIEIIRRIPTSAATPILYKIMAANRHSLSEIKEYKSAVLESCYDIFYYKNVLSLVFHVDKKSPISSLDFSEFLYSTAKVISSDVSAKASVHSPGEIILNITMDSIEYIQDHLLTILAIWTMVFGGKFKDFELPSLLRFALLALNYKRNKELKDLEVKEKHLDVESKEIQNQRAQLLLEKEKDEYGEYLKSINTSAKHLQLRPIESNVIDISEYINLIDEPDKKI